jgi:hypothetical protein
MSATILAAGDVAMCGTPGAEQTARQLESTSGTILPLGDLAYFQGSFAQFMSCYEPTWGRLKERSRPTPGNHEYESAGAGPYFDYFGPSAGPAGVGYYSFAEGSWLLLSMNSNLPSGSGSAQLAWVQAELRAHRERCALAYFHHPLFSSGVNGDTPHMRDAWQALYEGGVDVVLSAHDHVYERFAPQDPNGVLDPVRGIRQFTVGTGGATLTTFPRMHANSQVRHSGWGVLRMNLMPDRYEWEFLSASGGSFRDSGTGPCH